MQIRVLFLLVLSGCSVTVSNPMTNKDGGASDAKPSLGGNKDAASAADAPAMPNMCDSRLGTDACETCLGQKCCATAKACLDDQACNTACGQQGNPDDCAANEKGAALISCIQNDCAASCQ